MGTAVVTGRGAAAVVLTLLLSAGCGGASPTGQAYEARTLRMGSPYFDPDGLYTPAVAIFRERVAELSDGRIDIEMVFGADDDSQYWAYLPDGEQQIVRAVADGALDLAWTSTRVFDTLGAPAFGALHAPFVIDSYPLQEAVLRSDVPARLLRTLDPVGVRGLALLAGGLRRPVGVAGPLLGPQDYERRTFQHYRSEIQAAAVRALGATPTDVVSSARDEGLASGEIAGHEHSLHIYVVRHHAKLARYVTANVVLWPDMLALLASPEVDLTDQEHAWLQRAADDAAAGSVASADVDDERVTEACRQGAILAMASPAQLTALTAAVKPVVDELRREVATSTLLRDVERMKRPLQAPPLMVPTGCQVPS